MRVLSNYFLFGDDVRTHQDAFIVPYCTRHYCGPSGCDPRCAAVPSPRIPSSMPPKNTAPVVRRRSRGSTTRLLEWCCTGVPPPPPMTIAAAIPTRPSTSNGPRLGAVWWLASYSTHMGNPINVVPETHDFEHVWLA